jgi:hypothetical protein
MFTVQVTVAGVSLSGAAVKVVRPPAVAPAESEVDGVPLKD